MSDIFDVQKEVERPSECQYGFIFSSFDEICKHYVFYVLYLCFQL